MQKHDPLLEKPKKTNRLVLTRVIRPSSPKLLLTISFLLPTSTSSQIQGSTAIACSLEKPDREKMIVLFITRNIEIYFYNFPP